MTTEPFDPDVCPHRKNCWRRELVRSVSTIILAALTAWSTGCAFRVRGPGIDVGMSMVWPTSQPVVNDPLP
jgi:hypothetical protein